MNCLICNGKMEISEDHWYCDCCSARLEVSGKLSIDHDATLTKEESDGIIDLLVEAYNKLKGIE